MFNYHITFMFFCASCLFSGASLSNKIPLHIWQTAKSKDLPMAAIETRASWIALNPEFSCVLCDDAEIESYIRQKWGPEYLDFFHALPIGAMKADLWRYLVLASEGGVYSDIDSVCLTPVREWPLNGHTSGPHVLLLDLDSNQSQFCQWTFASTPGHPAMKHVCKYVLDQWKKKRLQYNADGTIDVLGTTGPAVFTAALKNYLKEDMPAFKIRRKYVHDKDYRKQLNRLGIFLTSKGFFSGDGSRNLFWGSWSREANEIERIERQ